MEPGPPGPGPSPKNQVRSSELPTRIRMSGNAPSSDGGVPSGDSGTGNINLENLLFMGLGPDLSGRKEGSRSGADQSQPLGRHPMLFDHLFPARSPDTSFTSKNSSNTASASGHATGLEGAGSSDMSALKPSTGGMDTLINTNTQAADSSTLSALFWAQQQPEQALQSLLGLDMGDANAPAFNADAAMQLLTPELRALLMQTQDPQPEQANGSTSKGTGGNTAAAAAEAGAAAAAALNAGRASASGSASAAPNASSSDVADLEQLLRQGLGGGAGELNQQAALELYEQLLAYEQIQQQQQLAARLASLQLGGAGLYDMPTNSAAAALAAMGGAHGMPGMGIPGISGHNAMLGLLGQTQDPTLAMSMGMGYPGMAMPSLQPQQPAAAQPGQGGQAAGAQQQPPPPPPRIGRRGPQLSPTQLVQVQELQDFIGERAELRAPGLLTEKEWEAVVVESKRRLLQMRLPLLEMLKILMEWLQQGYITQAEFDSVKQEAVMGPTGGAGARNSGDALLRKPGSAGAGTGVFLPGAADPKDEEKEKGEKEKKKDKEQKGREQPPPLTLAAAAAAANAPAQNPQGGKKGQQQQAAQQAQAQQQAAQQAQAQQQAAQQAQQAHMQQQQMHLQAHPQMIHQHMMQAQMMMQGQHLIQPQQLMIAGMMRPMGGPPSLQYGMGIGPGIPMQPPPPPGPPPSAQETKGTRRRSHTSASQQPAQGAGEGAAHGEQQQQQPEAARRSANSSFTDLTSAGISFPSAQPDMTSPRMGNAAGAAASQGGGDPGSVRSQRTEVTPRPSLPAMSAAVQTVLTSNTPCREVGLRSVAIGLDVAPVPKSKLHPHIKGSGNSNVNSPVGDGSSQSQAAAATAAAALNLGGGKGSVPGSPLAKASKSASPLVRPASGNLADAGLFSETADVKGLAGSGPSQTASGFASPAIHARPTSIRTADPATSVNPHCVVPGGLTFASMQLPTAMVQGLSDCGYIEPDLLQYRLLREVLPLSIFPADILSKEAEAHAEGEGGEGKGEAKGELPPRPEVVLKPRRSQRVTNDLLASRASAGSQHSDGSRVQILCCQQVPSAASTNAALCVALLREVQHTPRMATPSLASIASMAAMAALGARPGRPAPLQAQSTNDTPPPSDTRSGVPNSPLGGGSGGDGPVARVSGSGAAAPQEKIYPTPLAGLVVCGKREDAEDMGDTMRAIAHYMGVPCYTLVNTNYLPVGLGAAPGSGAGGGSGGAKPASDDADAAAAAAGAEKATGADAAKAGADEKQAAADGAAAAGSEGGEAAPDATAAGGEAAAAGHAGEQEAKEGGAAAAAKDAPAAAAGAGAATKERNGPAGGSKAGSCVDSPREAGKGDKQQEQQQQPILAVGSPSRLLDLMRKGYFDLSQFKILVLMDAASLLSTHCKNQVHELLVGCAHAAKQVLLLTSQEAMSRHDLRTLEKLVACAPRPRTPGAPAVVTPATTTSGSGPLPVFSSISPPSSRPVSMEHYSGGGGGGDHASPAGVLPPPPPWASGASPFNAQGPAANSALLKTNRPSTLQLANQQAGPIPTTNTHGVAAAAAAMAAAAMAPIQGAPSALSPTTRLSLNPNAAPYGK